jgi:hypothetical protein
VKPSSTKRSYAPEDAKALAPLLDSIVHEIEERTALLESIEADLAEFRESPFLEQNESSLRAEAASQRRELRHCREELERLGCSVVGTSPMTIRIPTHEGSRHLSRVWQPGQTTHD